MQGHDYIFPDTNAIKLLMDNGMNIFRAQFLMERLTPNGMTGSFDSAYLKNMTRVRTTKYAIVACTRLTRVGGGPPPATMRSLTPQLWAIVGSYSQLLCSHQDTKSNGSHRSIITSTSDFESRWEHVAGQFKSNSRGILDTSECYNNHSHEVISNILNPDEYHDMDRTLVLHLNQAAINVIRAAGATSQYIFVEGNSYTGAWTWLAVNDNLKALTDPQNKIVYEMHQYLDFDGSGSTGTCVSTTIGKERDTAATKWLKDNGKVSILDESAGGVNDQCKAAITVC